jgi:hypothetical protein
VRGVLGFAATDDSVGAVQAKPVTETLHIARCLHLAVSLVSFDSDGVESNEVAKKLKSYRCRHYQTGKLPTVNSLKLSIVS